MQLGNISVDVLSDGSFLLDGGAVFGQVPKTEWEVLVRPDRQNRIRLGLNCLLIRTPSTTILVDTGAGSKRSEKLRDTYVMSGNKLPKELKALELTARDIDIVILTHLHFDHAGGCTKLDRSGSAVPTFPKARYLVQRECWEDAITPNERSRAAFHGDDFLPLQDRGLVTLLDGDSEVVPGVRTVVADGHARGHQIVLVEMGSERIAYVADLIPTPYPLGLTHISAYDQDPNKTLASKRDVVNMALDGGWLLIFGHGHEDRAGYVERRNGTARLIQVEMKRSGPAAR